MFTTAQHLKLVLACALLTTLAPHALANEPRSIVLPGNAVDQMVYEIDPATWALPQRVLPPEYSLREVSAKRSGYVDVEVAIARSGRTENIRAISSTPPNPVFEESTREAIKHWKFHVTLTGCKPQESTGKVRIWFDIKDDKGVVSISNLKSADPAGKTSARLLNRTLFSNLPEVNLIPAYPLRAHRNNAFGEVYAAVTVDPKTGTVTGHEITHSESRPEGYAEDFIDEVKIALRSLKANTLSDQDKPLTACLPFVFRTR